MAVAFESGEIMNSSYRPIACALHDELEALATLRRECRIAFRGENGKPETLTDVIDDIFTRQREEFLRLRRGAVIRLDHIISIDDKPFDQTCPTN